MALFASLFLHVAPASAAPSGAVDTRPLAQAPACSSTTDVGGVVFRDFNANGTREPNERGLNGTLTPITVVAIAPSGQTLATAVTDVEGNYNLGPIDLSNGARIEFRNLPDWLQPGAFGGGPLPAGGASGTLVQFVNAASCTLDLGVNNPADYCDSNPDLATPCFVNGDPLAGGTSGELKTLVTWPYSENGWWFDYPTLTANADPPNELAQNSQMGPTWGLAWQRSTQTIFTSSLLKRHVGFGPLGPGGIYATDYSNPTAPIVTEYLDLNTIPGVDVGADPRTTPLPADTESSSYDPEAFDLVGKRSLGDMDISEDDQTLYVMNLFQRELLALDIASAAVISRTAVPDPGCVDSSGAAPVPAPDDRRPWAVRVHDGEVYIGVVCSAETSQLVEDLRAYIMRQEGDTFVNFFDFALEYPKGRVSFGNAYPGAEERTGWFPWTDDFDATISDNGETLMYPQPIFSNMEVDDDGSVIVGFVDRLGHQGGRLNRNTDLNDDNLYNAHSGGDILRLCNVGGTLVLEGVPECPSNQDNDQGPGGGEYYHRDTFAVLGGLFHNETALGGLAFLAGSGEVVSTHFDAVHHLGDDEPSPYPRTGGVRFFNNLTGAYSEEANGDDRAYEVYPDTDRLPGTFAKAAGLGDLELLCDQAPIEIGNYVWQDSNVNGVQDGNEAPLPNVTVELVAPGGEVLATAVTDTNGHYYFSSDATRSAETTASAIYGVEGLTLDTADYELRIPIGQAALAGLAPTLPNATGNTSNDNKTDLEDSDGLLSNGASSVIFDIGSAGANNHNMDFGFTSGVVDIFDLALRKTLSAGQSRSVQPGEPVNFTIEIFNQGTVPATNIQVVDYLDTIWTLTDPDWTLADSLATTVLPGPLAPGTSFTVEITLQLSATLGPGEYLNFAEISEATDGDGVARVDIDSTPDTDRDNDCNPQNDVINEDGKNNPCTEDEDDHDFEPVGVSLMSLGNRVWLDDGTGGGVADSGLQESGEPGVGNVLLNLLNSEGAPVLDTNGQPIVTNSQAQGYYLFDAIVPGDYIVCVDPANFQPGGPLENLLSSTPTESDPNADVDLNDNGFNDPDPATNGICSGAINLTPGQEPLNEPDPGPLGSGEASDDNSNLTLDFGFIPAEIAPGDYDLALRKTLATGQAAIVIPEDDVTFTIEVFNQGQVAATDIVVVDYIPDGLILNDPNWMGDGMIVSRTIPGPLAPAASTTLDIVFTVSADAPPGEIVNLAEISSATDETGREPEDVDSTPDRVPDNDCNPQDNVIDEDGKNNPCIEDEDDHDLEAVQVPPMSLGNRVWLDDGADGGVLDNGLLEGGERGIADVVLNLLDDEEVPVLDADGQPQTATTLADGHFLFDDLSPGNYIVCVDIINFLPDGPLRNLLSSGPTEEDPNANVDLNDNGLNNTEPEINGICSGVITLIFFEEPINEPDRGILGSGSASDDNSNITLDFGFVGTPTALDETEEPANPLENSIFMPLLRR